MNGPASLLLLLALAVEADAGAGVDAGPPPVADAGVKADAGTPAEGGDGGVVSPVVAAPDAGRRASVRTFTGDTLFDGGVSDFVELSVGASVELSFPRQTAGIICDDTTLFTLEPLVTSFRFTGLKPGSTFCGFWFEARPFPNRYVSVTIVP